MKQLNTLFKYELDKERKAAKALQQAELDYRENIQRLQSVNDYRLEYMKRLNERSLVGINSHTFSHFQAFVAKLDHAAEQVKLAVKQAKALVESRKKQWFLQREKLKAVSLLRDKKHEELRVNANKQEQKEYDEMANQQFIRRLRVR